MMGPLRLSLEFLNGPFSEYKNPILALFAGWDLFVICFRSVAEPDKSYSLEQSELAALFKQVFKSEHVGKAAGIFVYCFS